MMVALIFGVFVLVLLIGCPIAIALLLGGIVPIMALTDIPLGIVVQRLFSSANSYSMMAVPFFILAGNLMDTGGVSKRLVNLARSLVGWLPAVWPWSPFSPARSSGPSPAPPPRRWRPSGRS